MFQVPKSKASIKQNQFEFQLPGSKKVWALPKMQYLNADLTGRLGAATAAIIDPSTGKPRPDADPALGMEIAALQRQILEQYCPGLYALVDQEQLQAIVQAWQAESSITMGESPASSSS